MNDNDLNKSKFNMGLDLIMRSNRLLSTCHMYAIQGDWLLWIRTIKAAYREVEPLASTTKEDKIKFKEYISKCIVTTANGSGYSEERIEEAESFVRHLIDKNDMYIALGDDPSMAAFER